MFKKSIISLLSLLIVLSHVGQVQTKSSPATQVLLSLLKMHSHSRQAQTTLSPAAQAFFEPGNHDDVKFHMLGYLANNKRLSSLIEKKGTLSDALKNLVDLKDKTLQETLERLLAPINKNGQQSVNVRDIKIKCAQDAVKSGNQKMLEMFLPEIFAPYTQPNEHILFPEDLTSDEAREMLKQTGLLDLAYRYHFPDNDIAKKIESKFFNDNDLFWLGSDFVPVFVANGYRTDMHFAIHKNNTKKIQELLDGEKELSIKLNVFERIVGKMKRDDNQELCSLLEKIFPEEKTSLDRKLILKKIHPHLLRITCLVFFLVSSFIIGKQIKSIFLFALPIGLTVIGTYFAVVFTLIGIFGTIFADYDERYNLIINFSTVYQIANLVANPLQTIKNFFRSVIKKPRHLISHLQTRLLQTITPSFPYRYY